MKILSLFLVLLITSCTHHMEDQVVMDSKGNFYKLQKTAVHEGYTLEYIPMSEIDSIKIKAK